MSKAHKTNSWSLSSPEGRWRGFGPYYAMFPTNFAHDFIDRYSRPGDTVIDPFCGRGTSNYVAQIMERNSIGCDINPVAWVYSKTKTSPARQVKRLLNRVDQIWGNSQPKDAQPVCEFQEFAWSKSVLRFLNCARRELNWERSKIDRTLAAIILVYLHGKRDQSLSNQMRQSKSMAPDYAVRWWKKRNMKPPKIDPTLFIKDRIRWRYAKGLISNNPSSSIYLGDARGCFARHKDMNAKLLLTSPPYMGITDYKYDNWIRLWALGGTSLPRSDKNQRYSNKKEYKSMIKQVFEVSRRLLANDACVVVRTDRREFTLETTARILIELWPEHRLYEKNIDVTKATQTALFGDKTEKPGDVDLVVLPPNVRRPPDFKAWGNSMANS